MTLPEDQAGLLSKEKDMETTFRSICTKFVAQESP